MYKRQAQRAYDEALCEKPSADPSRIYENKVTLEIKPLLKLHRAVRMRVYTIALGRVGMTKNMTYAQAEGIDNILRSKSPSAMYDLSDDTGVSREYDKLSFFRGSAFAGENWETEWALSSMSEKEFGLFRQNCGGRIYGAFRGVSIDQLTVRTRRKGDWISAVSYTHLSGAVLTAVPGIILHIILIPIIVIALKKAKLID